MEQDFAVNDQTEYFTPSELDVPLQDFAVNDQTEYFTPSELDVPGCIEAPPGMVDMTGYMEAPPDMVDMTGYIEAPPHMVAMPKFMQAPNHMMAVPYYLENSPPMVVTTQPSMVIMPSPTVHKDYLTWSILNLIFCCLLLGCVAFRHSKQTLAAVHRQDPVAASSHSHSAFSWNLAAAVVGTCIHIAWIAYVIYYNVAGYSNTNNYYY